MATRNNGWSSLELHCEGEESRKKGWACSREMKGFRAGRGIVWAKFPLKNTMTASLGSSPISRMVIRDGLSSIQGGHPRHCFWACHVCCARRLTVGCSSLIQLQGPTGRGSWEVHGAHSPEVGWSWDVLDISGGRCGCRVHECVLTSEPGAPAQVLWPGALPWPLRPASGRHPRTTPGVQRPRKFRYSGCHRSTPGWSFLRCAVLLTLCWKWVVAPAGQLCPQSPSRSGSWCLTTLRLYLWAQRVKGHGPG